MDKMRNEYVADVGDYGKYSLLQHLSGSDFALGVVWYLNLRQESNEHGGFTEYLDPKSEELFASFPPAKRRRYENLRRCNEPLHAELRLIVRNGEVGRNVCAVKDRGLLGPRSIFFSRPVGLEGEIINREDWQTGAVDCVKDCDIVMLDPDNGLLTGEKMAQEWKYAFKCEVKAFASKHTVVLYQHINRASPASDQIDTLRTELIQTLPERKIHVLRFQRGSSRLFCVIPQHRHEPALTKRLQQMLARWDDHQGWRHAHFELVPNR
jgi:hypothetical protein